MGMIYQHLTLYLHSGHYGLYNIYIMGVPSRAAGIVVMVQ